MELIIIKIIMSVAMVLMLVFISEKSPKLGGLLAGLPLSVGILVFFYAYQQGIEFTVSTMPYAIAGLSSSITFIIGFDLGAKLFVSKKFINALSAFFVGLSAYVIVSSIITLFEIDLMTGLIIFLLSMIIAIIYFRNIPPIKRGIAAKRTIGAICFRIFFATALIIGVTTSASMIGPEWAGILASFPAMTGSVIIILLYSYKDALYQNVLKHFSYSISILALYELLVMWLYPAIGITLGTLLAYAICLVYLYFLSQIGRFRRSK